LTFRAMRIRILPKGAGWSLPLLMLISALDGVLLFGQIPDDALRHFQAGRLDDAKRILLNQAHRLTEEPEMLFYLGRVEERGDLSGRYFRSITDRCPDWERSDQAGLLLCKYEFCRGMNLAAIERAGMYEDSPAQSEAAPEFLWVSGCSFLATDQVDSALLKFEQILRSFPGSRWAQWAQLGRGDCLFAEERYDQAVAEYQKVLDVYKYSQAFPFALSGLAISFARLGDPERALLYHNLLKEKYPRSAESVREPVEAERPIEGVAEPDRAERLAGVRYTVQLGVFGQKENAQKLRSQFEKQGYSVRVESKVIGGKRSDVVQLGSFVSYQEASELKRKLESQTGESYRVVIR
jgi:tetratricopeptide (TPR) repeat protein